MPRWIRIALLVAGAVVLAGLAFVLFAPAERFRDKIIDAVSAESGHTLTIGGGINFSLTPAPGLTLSDVTLPGNAVDAPLIHADSVALAVDFFPLLMGNLKVNQVALDGCTITLSRGKDGTPNWYGSSAPVPGIGDITLKACKIIWRDESKGQAVDIEAADLRLRWPQDGSALSIAGEFSVKGERFDIDGSIGTPSVLLSGGRAAVRAELGGPLLKGTVDGDADLQALRFEGGVNLSVSSARRLASLFGIAIPGDRGLGEVSLAASARLLPGEAHFRDAKFTLDGMTGSGVFGVEVADGMPDFTGSLNVDRFDLATYISLQEPEGAEGDEAGWNTAAFDLSDAAAVALDLGIKAKRATILGIAVDDADLSITASKGAVGLSLVHGLLNGGTVEASLSADTAHSPASVSLSANLANADAGTVLPDIAEIETLTGRLTVKLDVRGTGHSQRELVAGLAGTADIALRDGALSGIDLEAVAGGVSGNEGFGGVGEDEATNFSSLAAHFEIAGGVARTEDLSLIGPFLRVKGRGAVGLPGRMIQMLMAPRVVGDIYGQQDNQPRGLGMPFVITGPFAAPIYIPDYADVVDRIGKGEIQTADLGQYPPPVRDWIVAAIAAHAAVHEPPPLPGVSGL